MPLMLENVPKIFVVKGDGSPYVEEMFIEHGWNVVNNFDDADMIQFVGGADVNPALYYQHRHESVHPDITRDEREQKIYLKALELGIPMAGICRGGQFLNVMNGGSMYQDVDGHALHGTHDAYLRGNEFPIRVTSTHHQMMAPNYSADMIILMTAGESTRKDQMSYNNSKSYGVVTYPMKSSKTDVEVIFYRTSRCLCFQPHPEYSSYYAQETRDVYFQLLEDYIFGEEEIQLKDEA